MGSDLTDFVFVAKWDMQADAFSSAFFGDTEMLSASSLYAGRSYHDFGHACRVSAVCRDHPFFLGESLQFERVVMRAALWHDAVYLPGGDENESKSALMGCVWAPPEDCAGVSDAILATRHSAEAFIEAAGSGTHAQCLADADLIWLALPWSQYEKNSHLIKSEFSWVGDREYTLGRVDWIVEMLGRERLFHADEWERVYGGAARRNLESELSVMSELVRQCRWKKEAK